VLTERTVAPGDWVSDTGTLPGLDGDHYALTVWFPFESRTAVTEFDVLDVLPTTLGGTYIEQITMYSDIDLSLSYESESAYFLIGVPTSAPSCPDCEFAFLTEFDGTPALGDHVIGWVGSSGTEGVLVLGRPDDAASYVRWAATDEDGLLSGGYDYMYAYDDYFDGYTHYYGYRYTISVTVD
jgi:hypothetical protein